MNPTILGLGLIALGWLLLSYCLPLSFLYFRHGSMLWGAAGSVCLNVTIYASFFGAGLLAGFVGFYILAVT